MSEQERRDYHDLSKTNQASAGYVRRLREADALIFQFPVWSFGRPRCSGVDGPAPDARRAFRPVESQHGGALLANLSASPAITTYGRPCGTPCWSASAVKRL